MQPEITPAELAAQLADASSNLFLLDVREPWEWQLTHLDGSRHLPMHLVPLRHNELPDDRLIVALCHHGVRSLQVCHYLRDAGFDQVVSLQGGLDAWAAQIDANMPRY